MRSKTNYPKPGSILKDLARANAMRRRATKAMLFAPTIDDLYLWLFGYMRGKDRVSKPTARARQRAVGVLHRELRRVQLLGIPEALIVQDLAQVLAKHHSQWFHETPAKRQTPKLVEALALLMRKGR